MEEKILAPEGVVNEVKDVKITDRVTTEGYGIFTLLKRKNTFYVAVGMNIVSRETFTKKADVKKYIDSKPWELMLNTFAVMADAMIKDKIENLPTASLTTASGENLKNSK